MEKKERNSNYELMRIVSMFMIIIWHIIIHSHILNNYSNYQLKKVLEFILDIIVIHVNSFILVTGYFQSTNKFKQSKVWSLIGSNLFYKVVIVIIFTLFINLKLTNSEYVREFFIFNYDEYWFVKYYIFLYMLSPFLNILIQKMNKKQYQKFLLVLFFMLSFLPFITGNNAYSNDGSNLTNFLFLYFIGAYLRKYPMKEWYIFKNLSTNMYRVILIFTFLLTIIFNYSLAQTNGLLRGTSSLFNELFGGMSDMTRAYSNPFIIIQSIAYLCFFGTLNFKNRIINNISKLVIGVYLIHDNKYVRYKLYDWFKIGSTFSNSYKILIYILFVSIIIFVSCSIIEYIRQMLFKFIYNRKFSYKIRQKYKNWIVSLGID